MDHKTTCAVESLTHGVLKKTLKKLPYNDPMVRWVTRVIFLVDSGSSSRGNVWRIGGKEPRLIVPTDGSSDGLVLLGSWIEEIVAAGRSMPDLRITETVKTWTTGKATDYPLWPYMQAAKDLEATFAFPVGKWASTMRYLVALHERVTAGSSPDVGYACREALSVHRLAIGTGHRLVDATTVEFEHPAGLTVSSFQAGTATSTLRMPLSRAVARIALSVVDAPSLRAVMEALPADPAPAPASKPAPPQAAPKKSWLARLMGT